MDETWARVVLVSGALLVAGALAVWQRRRATSKPERSIDAAGFDPGVYFFSSSACASCARARQKLEARLGDGFVEYNWEQAPGTFADLDVDAVPAVLIVDESGSATLFPGQPDRALRRV